MTVAQQERAIRTRRVILATAAEIFDERGYESTTIAEILERADVTKGALYFHFPSKEHLARGVLAAAVTTDGVRPQALKLQELIDIVLLLAYRLPREPVLSAALRMAIDPQSRRQFGTRWVDWTELLTALLKEAKERGEVCADVDETETARMLVCCWTGVQVVTEGLPGSYDLAGEIASFLRRFMPTIAEPGVMSRLTVSAERAAHLHDDMPAWRSETGESEFVGLTP
ncbi:ScbR family autoregulator-binding transcription factor [Streptomyces clavifer]|uniref:ScbR family autoregulator-binding transcription factor n=1 Tax=Streptomyces clavifer TaxID=68188 RepID=UPI003091CFF7|nr:TetR/AcrR family transcriptional regulator [Streptomyces clavifer]WRY86201.1 TetR/AcrR family transcriptional regulator [Streptomyces clavifer]